MVKKLRKFDTARLFYKKQTLWLQPGCLLIDFVKSMLKYFLNKKDAQVL